VLRCFLLSSRSARDRSSPYLLFNPPHRTFIVAHRWSFRIMSIRRVGSSSPGSAAAAPQRLRSTGSAPTPRRRKLSPAKRRRALFGNFEKLEDRSMMAISILTNGVPYTQDFNSLANSGTSSVMPTDWVFNESSGNTLYTAGTGSLNAGDTYSFGAASSTERALGSVQSGSNTPIFGTSFINNTGGPISALTVSYTGEQWRLGATGRGADRLDFQYSKTATAVHTGIYEDIDPLDFVAPISVGTVGALDGNAPANRVTYNYTMPIPDGLPAGGTIWIRWNSWDTPTGADDGLAIDDFSITSAAPMAPAFDIPNQNTLSYSPITLNFPLTDDVPNTVTFQVISSSDETLIPLENVVVTGTGAQRTLTITPAGPSGTSEIVIRASDGSGPDTDETFTVNVTGAPTLYLGKNISRRVGDLVQIPILMDTNAEHFPGILGIDIAVLYDTNYLQMLPTSPPGPGPGPASSTAFTPLGYSDDPGKVTMSFSRTVPITANQTGIQVGFINAIVKATAPLGLTPINMVKTTTLSNLTVVTTQIAEGKIAMGPEPTNASNDPQTDGSVNVIAGGNSAPTHTILQPSFTVLEDKSLKLFDEFDSNADPYVKVVDASAGQNFVTTKLSVPSSSVGKFATGFSLSNASVALTDDNATLTVTGLEDQVNLVLKTLQFVPAPDRNSTDGTVTVMVETNDTIATTKDSFDISITPVNDRPSFTVAGNQTAANNAGAVSVPGFVTSTSVGPTNETGSIVSYSRTAPTSSVLFSSLPTLSAAGTLSYTPAPGQTGSVTVTFTGNDGGGTANGGQQVSLPVSFTITITAGAGNIAPVNSFPVGPIAGVEDTPLPLSGGNLIQVNDADAASTSISTVVSVPTGVGAFTWTANASTVTPVITNGGATITFTGAQDQIRLALQTLVFNPTPQRNDAIGPTIVTVDSNDGAGGTDSDSFTINVAAVNDTPSFTTLGNQAVNEDAGPQTVNSFATANAGGGTDENSQTFTYNITNNTNSTLFTGGGQPSISSAGVLTYTPAPNAFGVATITLSVSDNGSPVGTSATQQFTITVNSVNDTPSFTTLGNQAVNEDAGPQTVNSFATANAGGGTDENGQTFTYNITNNTNSTLFTGGGQPSISPTGVLTYTPAPNAFGVATITVSVSDNGSPVATSATQQFTITVNSVNDTPSFTTLGNQAVNEDAGPQTVNSFASANAGGGTDENGQTFTYNITNNSNSTLFTGGGQPSISPTGVLTYTPAANAFGVATITVSVSDNGSPVATSATQQFTITVNSVNDTPTFTTLGNQAVNEDAGPQTVNSFASANAGGGTDENGQTFTYNITNNTNSTLFTGGGQPSISSTGVLTYTPAPNAFGVATITLSVSDNGSPVATSATQQFTITVNSVNDTPSFTTLGNQAVNEDAGPQTVNSFATANAGGGTDENGQTFTYNITNNTNSSLFTGGGQPSISSTGVLTYTPAPNAFGVATITLSVSDNGSPVATSATQQFTITVNSVNDTPSFTTLGNQTVNEDAPQQTVNSFATANAGGGTDENGQTFTYNITNNSNSTLFTLGGQPSISPTGVLTYTPAAHAFGVATITLSVSDNGSPVATSATQQFTITLNSVNDAPSFTKGADQTVPFNSPAQSVTGWATSLSAGPPNETQNLSFNVTNDFNGLFSSQPVILPNGTLQYTPMANASGTAIVTVRIVDDGGTALSGVDTSAPQTFTITVQPAVTNIPPTINPIAPNPLNINEDAGLQTVNLSGITAGGAETQNLIVTASSNNATLTGTITVNYTPNNPTGSITFTPAANVNGTAIITVTVTDAGIDTIPGNSDDGSTPVSFTVNVAAVNDTPSFTTLGNQAVNEDAGPQTVNSFATANAGGGTDENGQTFTYNITNNDNSTLFTGGGQPSISSTGVLTYTPAPNAFGVATITVSVSDNGSPVATSATQQFTITVNSVNDTPTFTTLGNQTVNEDAGPQTVNSFATANAGGGTDENGQTFTYNITNNTNSTLFTGGGQPSISSTGVLTYTPAANAFGVATITVSVSDNGSPVATSATQQFTITVNSVNDTPSFTTLGNQSVNEDAGPQTVNSFATANAGGGTDENGQTFTYNITNNTNSTLFTGGGQPSISSTGVLTYTPAANAFGVATITVSVSDNGSPVATSATQQFTITVNSVNDTPTFTTLGNQTVNEDAGPQTVNSFATANAGGGTDENGQTFTYNITNNNNSALFTVGGQPTISPTGVLTYTPVANTNGVATITVSVSDNGSPVATSTTQQFTITVTALNDAPSFVAGADPTILEDAGAQSISNFATGFSPGPGNDAGQTVLNYLVSGVTPGFFSSPPSVDANGTLTYTVAPNTYGNGSFQLQVRDNGGAPGVDTSAAVTVTINVTQVNDAPTFVLGGDQTAAFNGPMTVVGGFATSLSPGPLDPAQTLTFQVSNDNNSLFSGQPTIALDGTLTFTPATGQSGTATVTVRLADNGGTLNNGIDISPPQTFTITIGAAPVNTPPTINALSPNPLNINEDAGLQTISLGGITAGGAEVQNLTVTASSNNAGLTGTINVTYTPNGSTGSITFTPVANANGTAIVTVTVTDAGFDNIAGNGDDRSTPVTMTVNVAAVNDTPSFTTLGNQAVNEDAGLTTVNSFATANAGGGTDENGQTFTYNITNNSNSALFTGGGQPSISPTGVLTYIPAANANGTATITVSVSDNGSPVATSATQQFTITVNAVNDTPSFTTLGNQAVAEDAGPQTVNSFATASAGGGTDENGQTFTYNITNNSNSALFTGGGQPSISPTGVLTYTPAANISGVATITVSVSDNGSPVATSATQQFTITVTAVNDAPSFVAGANPTILEDAGAQTISNFASGFSPGPGNDAGQTLLNYVVSSVTPGFFSSPPSVATNGTLTYTVAANAFGSGSFQLQVVDDGGTPGVDTSAPITVTINVTPVNDVPVFIGGVNQSVAYNAGPQTVNGWATGITTGASNESQTLSFELSNTNNGLFSSQPTISPAGTLQYTPAANTSGTATVTVRLRDNGGVTDGGVDLSAPQTFTITVAPAPINTLPTINPLAPNPLNLVEDAGLQTIGLSGISAGGADTQNLIVTASSNNPSLTGPITVSYSPNNPTGSISFTPVANANGTATITVTVTDAGLDNIAGNSDDGSTPVTLVVNVSAVNDTPSFTVGPNQSVNEDPGAQTINPWAMNVSRGGGTDEASQALTFNLVGNSNPSLFSALSISSTGVLSYTPTLHANGSATITVSLSDDGGGANTSATQQFTITVNALNDPPVFTIGVNQTVNEDAGPQTVNPFATGIGPGGGTDEAGQTVNFNITNNSNLALFSSQPTISPTGVLTYTPTANAVGTATITVTLSDNGGGASISAPQTFTITVNGVNDPPSFVGGFNVNVNEDSGPQTLGNWAALISAGPGDEASQTLTFNVTANSNPTLFSSPPSVSANGTLTFTPAANANGVATISVQLSDNGGGSTNLSAVHTFTISVNAINDAPSFTAGANQVVNEDAGPQTVNPWATAVAAGPTADEALQTLTFNLTGNSNLALFSSQPTISSAGVLSYTPAANASGVATITVTLSDNGGGASISDPQTFTITVNAVNDPPLFIAGPNQTVNEDSGARSVAWAGAISAGPADEVGQTVSFSVTGNSNPTLFSAAPAISPTGVLTYTPAANAFGSATITYTASDSAGATTAPQTFTITVNPVNDAPSFAVGPNQTIAFGSAAQTVVGFATLISTGPSNESAQTLQFNIVGNSNPLLFSTPPAIAPNGTLTYTPAPAASGSSTITVSLTDNGGTDFGGVATSGTQTFTITITAQPVNNPPTINPISPLNINEDAGLQTVALSGITAGTGGESQPLTVTVVSSDPLIIPTPSLSYTSPNSFGTLNFTPVANAFGTVTITVTVRDTGLDTIPGNGDDGITNMPFTVTVNPINDTPSFTVGANQTVNEDAGAQTVNPFATAISTGPANEASQTLTFNVTGNSNLALFSSQPTISSAGVLSYTPAANASGVATITVTLSDNGGGASISNPQTFTITVNPVNDAPLFIAGPNQTVNEDSGAQSVAWAGAISAGPADEVGQTVSFSVTGNSNPTLFSVAPAISPSGVLTYTPAANAFGSATITYTASDSAGATTAPQTFTITVNPVNDAPSFAVGPNQTIAFGSAAQTVVGFATLISTGPSNESAQTLQFNIVGNSNPLLFSTPPAIAPNGTLTYTPAPAASGSSTITVSLTDNGGTDFGGVATSGTQTFTITITAQPVNNPPTINPISPLNINEDAGLQTVALSGITAGTGGESQPLTVTVVSSDPLIIPTPSLSYTSPDSFGTLNFTPVANAFGTVTITVTVRDTGLDTIPGNGDDGITNMPFTVTVNPINDTPSFTVGANQTVNEDAGAQTVNPFATAISAGPANESGQTLTFSIVGNNNPSLFSVAPSISPTGVLTYTPAPNAFGSATISVTLSDNGGGAGTTAIQSFTITVNPVNDAPNFTVGANQTVNEDAGPQTVGNWASALSAGPANENGQTLSFNISNNSNPSLFSVLPTVSPTGTLTYTPAANVSGTATITLNIVDNGGTANGGVDVSGPQTFTITVSNVNDTPSFTAGASQTVNEDAGPQTVNPWATAISAGPANESGQTLTFNVTSNSNPLLFSSAPAISSTGVLTYTPAANAFGSATITVTLSDNGGGANTSAPQTFTITVNPVNDAPSFVVGPNQVVNEDAGGQSVSGFVSALSAGPANESSQTVTVNVTGNSNAALFSSQPTISPSGTLSYTPAANASGVATITVTVSDNGGTANGGVNTSAPQTFTITVTAVNDNPTFTPGSSQSVNEDAGPQSVANWATGISAGPANESGQVLTFLVTGNSNPGLFSAGPSISSTGTLTYTPAPNANGSALISVQLNDDAGGASTVHSFTINVAPVNDAPSFTAGANQTVPEDAGAQVVSGWATSISVGPANEAGQTVAFNVTGNTNAALFSVQPTISPAGVLTYTPAPNASGSATITLVAVDSGGTSNGGVNTSAPQTFTINVTPVNDGPDAADSTFTTPLNTPLNASVVVIDPDGPTLTYTLLMPPGLGSVSLNNSTGAFTYTPNTGATGLDLFTFSVTDGTTTDTATVRISIQASTAVVTSTGGNIQVVGTGSEDTVIISRGPSGQALVRTTSGGVNASAYYPLTGTITVSAGDGRDYIVVNGLTNATNIDAGAGDDYISSGTGDDIIIAGPGNDQVNASSGNNVVWGDELGQQDLAVGGNDVLSSLGGNDVMYGGGGDDQLYPGDGQDYVYAGQGNDLVSAGGGNDRVFGGAGNDLLVGDGGDDVISGGSGNDFILGSEGNDVLIGGAGGSGDSIDGGGGNDLLIAGDTSNSQSSLVNDANDAALMALLTNWNATHAAGIASGIVSGDDGAVDSLTGGTGDDDFYALLSDTVNDLNTTGSGTDRRFP
jgi:hypothetical protein